MDCRNVTSFFKKKGAQPAVARSLFDFVIDADLAEEDQEDRLKVGVDFRVVDVDVLVTFTFIFI